MQLVNLFKISLGISFTSFGENCAVATVCYSEQEVAEHPVLVDARLLHELTHAIRYALIRTCCPDDVDADRMLSPTPPKPHIERYFEKARDVGLYKLEQSSFHAGYYLEHMQRGGVWVRMLGSVLDSATDRPVQLGATGRVVKIVRRTGHEKYVPLREHDSRTTCKFEAFEVVEKNGEEHVLYHCGTLVTHHDDDDTCRR